MKYEITITNSQAMIIKETLVSRLNEMWDDLNNQKIPEMLEEIFKHVYVEHKLELRVVFEQLEPAVKQGLINMQKNGCPDEAMKHVVKRLTLKDPYLTQKNLH